MSATEHTLRILQALHPERDLALRLPLGDLPVSVRILADQLHHSRML